jgi:hypothetical protein
MPGWMRRQHGSAAKICKLYWITTNQAVMVALYPMVNRYVGNLTPVIGPPALTKV